MLQNITKIDGNIITPGELIVRAQYIWYMKDITNWYWEKHTLRKDIKVTTCTIIHPSIDVIGISQYIPKSVCNRIQEKKPYKDILFV